MFFAGALIGAAIGGMFGGSSGSNSTSTDTTDHEGQRAHDERMQRLQNEQEAERTRQLELQNEQKLKEQQLEKAHDKEMRTLQQDHGKIMNTMKYEAEEKERVSKTLEKQREREHKIYLVKLKGDLEAQRQKHQEDLKQMQIDAKERDRVNKEKQRDQAVDRVRNNINGLSKQIQQDQEQLTDIKLQLTQKKGDLDLIGDDINNFNKTGKLKEEKRRMDDTERDYKRDDDEIIKSILKTGQHESNVSRFLKLTHQLIGETVSTQQESNKLDAQLSTFYTLISRECQHRVTIEYYFKETNLERFTPILAAENFGELQDLVCENEDEFKEDILELIEEKIDEQINEWNKHNKGAQNEIDLLLSNYGLQKFISSLKKAGLTSLNDIDGLEEDDINELALECKMGSLWKIKLKKAFKAYQSGKYKPQQDNDDEKKDTDKKPLEIQRREKRILKNICLNPDTWKQYETEKARLTKLGLLEFIPVLAIFFNKMYVGMKEAQQVLTVNGNNKLNNHQIEAIEILMDNTNNTTQKAIEAAPDEDANNDEDEKKTMDDDDESQLLDYEQRKGWKAGSECEIYSVSLRKWFNGIIINIFKDDEGEWLEVKYNVNNFSKTKQIQRFAKEIRDPLMIQCQALNATAVVNVSVIETMKHEFNKSSLTLRALAVAIGVEDSCKQIILCHAQIRQSVILAQAILKLKPGNLTKEAKPLWEAIDNGIVHILSGSIEMVSISTKYFGFFLQFNQSFQRFISMYVQDENVSLFTSLEHIKSDIIAFSKFKQQFHEKTQILSDEAMKCIKDCVSKHVGVETFEAARISREKTLKLYLEAKDEYDKKSLILDDKFDQLCVQRAKLKAEYAKLEYQEEMLQNEIETNNKYINQYRAQESELNSLNFDAFQEDK